MLRQTLLGCHLIQGTCTVSPSQTPEHSRTQQAQGHGAAGLTIPAAPGGWMGGAVTEVRNQLSYTGGEGGSALWRAGRNRGKETVWG